MKNISVRQMTSPRSGRPVENQFAIAFRPRSGPVVLDKNSWDCSPTTSKYRNQFLGQTTAETRANIKSGDYVLAALND